MKFFQKVVLFIRYLSNKHPAVSQRWVPALRYTILVNTEGNRRAPLKAHLNAEDAIYWTIKLLELDPASTPAIIRRRDDVRGDWLTENLPKTNPAPSTRPGAEYGIGANE